MSWMIELCFVSYNLHEHELTINCHDHYTDNSPFLASFLRVFEAVHQLKAWEQTLQYAEKSRQRAERLWSKLQKRPTKECLQISHEEDGIFRRKPIKWEEWNCSKCTGLNLTKEKNTYCKFCSQQPERSCKRNARSLVGLDGKPEERDKDREDDPDYDTKEKKKKEKQKTNKNVAIQNVCHSKDPRPSAGNWWYYLVVVPKEKLSPRKIKMSIDLSKPKKGLFEYGYCVQKTDCQIACHLGLHNKPHGVYGLCGKNKMVELLGLKKNQIVMMPSYKDHLYNNSSPDKPVIINKGDHIWNYGSRGYFDKALLAQGF